MAKIQISLSSTPQLDDFLAACILMVVSLSDRDIPERVGDFKRYYPGAKKFATQYGFAADFAAVAKVFAKAAVCDVNLATEFDAFYRPKIAEFTDDVRIGKEQLGMLKDIGLFMRKDSPAAFSRIAKRVTLLGKPELNSLFAESLDDLDDMSSVADEMRRIVLKLTGRKNDPILMLTELRDLRTSNEKLITRYVELRKQFVAAYKKAVMSYVRNSGQPNVPVSEMRKVLAKLDCDYIPKGFVGRIDDTGKLYTQTGLPIAGMLIGEVVMNPKYSPKTDDTYVCSLKSNPSQSLRTETMLHRNKVDRFAIIGKLSSTIDKFEKRWQKDLKSFDPRTKLVATIVDAVWQAQARIGTPGNVANDEETFGISTVQKRHVKATAAEIHISYPGKKGTMQDHVFSKAQHPVLFKNILEYYRAAKKPTDLVFTLPNTGTAYSSSPCNKYLRELGMPEGTTIHKFRHVKGTKYALEVLEKSPFEGKKPSQTEAERWFKEAMKEVGEKLHHQTGGKVTGMTAISSYISPAVSAGFFTDLKLRVPAWIPKAGQ